MSSTKSIFLLGATGYVGGSLLVSLLAEYPSIHITALIRKPEAGEHIKALSPEKITVFQGSHSDYSLIEAEVEKADIVINAADSDDLGLTNSVINGLKKKSKKGVLIHTSGSVVIIAGGMVGPFVGKLGELDQKIWDDTNTEDIRSIPTSALHRPVDLAIFEAHNAGIADTYIICPGLIYGIGTGPIKTISIQIPAVIKIALRRREVLYVGEGTNIWCNIHIHDLIRMYIHIIDHSRARLASDEKVDAYENFYFAASGESSMRDMVTLVAPVLYKKGLVDKPQPRGIPTDEEPMLGLILGHSSRAVSKRARLLGWSPQEKGLNEAGVLEADVENFLSTQSISQ